MKYVRVGLPVFVVLACIWCLFISYMDSNHMGLMGYTTALFGWLAIVHDEYLTYLRENRNA